MSNFATRHIGPNAQDLQDMCQTIGVADLSELIQKAIPDPIPKRDLELVPAMQESEWLEYIRACGAKNQSYKNFIGQGYYASIMPAVIARNVLENPAWYTAYTPYQAEISQGRLEVLFNFQTMIAELTGMQVANASLLDEGSASAEAMTMAYRIQQKTANKSRVILADKRLFTHIKKVLQTRAEPLSLDIRFMGVEEMLQHKEEVFAAIIAYPNNEGVLVDFTELNAHIHDKLKGLLLVHTDLLALTLFPEPARFGADIVVGSVQRFGLPMGYGGPHAAFLGTREEYLREMPGRIAGLSKDALGDKAYRLTLQTREQHIKRARATSNICTAQALLAILATFYAQYHGAEGLRQIATRIHRYTYSFRAYLAQLGYNIADGEIFDTISIFAHKDNPLSLAEIRSRAEKLRINLYIEDNERISLSFDECSTVADIAELQTVFSDEPMACPLLCPPPPVRKADFLQSGPFNLSRNELSFLRYIRSLEEKDLSLCHAMIPLGSCTMKLNSTASLIPLSDPNWANLHPLVPAEQAQGFQIIIEETGKYLKEITGFAGISFQPNSGAQGEYTGLMIIRAYHAHRGQSGRNVVLIPNSAHGTNPASASMAGMEIVTIKTLDNGVLDMQDLRANLQVYGDKLAGCMITYPSTYGFFEKEICQICELIHEFGGLVYMDGANMNAQAGITSPALIGADVCHLNLHKTFSIPHGGGGPGAGPVAVVEKLVPFLPENPLTNGVKSQAIGAVSSAPYGSALLILITNGYIRMLGANGIKAATSYAILNANYIKERLKNHLPIRFDGAEGMVAHEVIIDFSSYKKEAGIEATDVAKRLIDYGFHPPTLSFPIVNTLMIEPTESESKAELDRFCDAMISIKAEIDDIIAGRSDREDNVLKNSPHPIKSIASDNWQHEYSREQAAYPLPCLRERKFWPYIARINDAYGDRNPCCRC